MKEKCIYGILVPFLGTALGSGCVLFMKERLNGQFQRVLTGFAAGVMVAASIWSLLLPAIDQSADMGVFAFVPALVGIWLGILFLLLLDRTVPHLEPNSDEREGLKAHLKKTTMLVLAVTIHNIPEGMAVGILFAGWLGGNAGITIVEAMTLAVGIAIQNFPEGAIISMPLRAEGMSTGKALVCGVLSGIVEPIAAVLTIWASGWILPWMPYLLSFAAGAMFYVVVEELMPELYNDSHAKDGIFALALGFSLMLMLDIAL